MDATNLVEANQIDAAAASQAAAPVLPAVQPVAASFADLKAACPGADSEFLCEQLAAQATVDQARNAWMKTQADRLAAQQKQLDELKTQTAAAAKRPGVEPVGGNHQSAAASGDPIAAFNEAVAEKMKAGTPKRQAVREAIVEDAGRYEAYLEAYNQQHRDARHKV